nr:TerD family protein [Pseudoclavibacter chungangensis]
MRVADARPASICWEVYRRGEGWKIRAVGQGYDGGLGALLVAHGVEVEDDGASTAQAPAAPTPGASPPPSTAGVPHASATPFASSHSSTTATPHVPASAPAWTSSPGSPVGSTSGPAGSGVHASGPLPSQAAPQQSARPEWQGPAPADVPVLPQHAFERMMSVFEDAARSVATYESVTAHATDRLDGELSTALADPASRATGGGSARDDAQRRHDDLVAQARARLEADHSVLAHELRVIDPQLPAPLASWDSPSWLRRGPAPDGIRVGEVHTTHTSLRVPLCVYAPMIRPLWLDGPSNMVAPAAIAVVLRLLALDPAARVEIVDPRGELTELAQACGPLLAASPAVLREDIAARIANIVDRADRTLMSIRAGVETDAAPTVLVLGDLAEDIDEQNLVTLIRLLELGPAHGVSMIVTGPPGDRSSNSAVTLLDEVSMHLPVTQGQTLRDPWVGSEWQFDIDLAPFDPSERGRIVETLAHP